MQLANKIEIVHRLLRKECLNCLSHLNDFEQKWLCITVIFLAVLLWLLTAVMILYRIHFVYNKPSTKTIFYSRPSLFVSKPISCRPIFWLFQCICKVLVLSMDRKPIFFSTGSLRLLQVMTNEYVLHEVECLICDSSMRDMMFNMMHGVNPTGTHSGVPYNRPVTFFTKSARISLLRLDSH